MHGTIWAESDGIPGRGSLFQFTVRVTASQMPADTNDAGEQPALSGRRALVVDDNATNRHILGLQLQSWGVFAVEAADAAAPLDLFRRGDQYDIVLLDMQMPGMDGIALAKAICAQRGPRPLPIVMLTSLGRDLGSDARAVSCFAGYLTKPVKASQLYNTLVAALVRGDGRVATSPDTASTPEPRRAAALPLRILLAEDMEVNRRFALLALEELGYRADVAGNGREVLEQLARRQYDVILMDVQMPEIDGLDATRSIRRDWPVERQPHIVAMTANAMQGDREICLSAGMDDYVSKPVYLVELRRVLERAAARVAAWPVSAPPVDAPAEPSIDVEAVKRLLARRDGRSLIKLFITEAGEAIRTLRAAVDRGDRSAARQAAHQLKGSGAYVGARRVVTLSAEIEAATRRGDLVSIEAIRPLDDDLSALEGMLMDSA